MRTIDEQKLESDLAYRFSYLCEFIGFAEDEINTILRTKEQLIPLVPSLVDAVYEKLFSYDCTKRHFVPRQHGYEGEAPPSLEELTVDHPQIQFRKKHLGIYLKKLVTGPYDAKMLGYLDLVGKIHTPQVGSDKINVSLVQMNALLGFVCDALIATIQSWDMSVEEKFSAVRAFSKLLWLQNDLINRHYCGG